MLIQVVGSLFGLLFFLGILSQSNPEAEYARMIYEYTMRKPWDDGTFEDGSGI